MPKSFVLMTALPPTTGHLDLIRFAESLTPEVKVIVCTQPGEPYVLERFMSLFAAVDNTVTTCVRNFHREIQQEPRADLEYDHEFWGMWEDILRHKYGFEDGDYIVSSEAYGVELAKAVGGVFMPYDPNRDINRAKASLVRNNVFVHSRDILPEFMPYINKKVTLFGAESVGKTTVSKELSKGRYLPVKTDFRFEWARPYLELVGPEITEEKMHRIFEGQAALQETAWSRPKAPLTLFDTDLFSTVGYWEMWNPETVPQRLLDTARALRSDLYIILAGNVPFTPDPLRYGGDHRESDDQFWIDLCEREGLPYVYVTDSDDRTWAVYEVIKEFIKDNPLQYQRIGREYDERGV